MIDRFADQGAFAGEISVDSWHTRPGSWRCITPRCDRLFVKPYGEAATVDQRAAVRVPITAAIANHRVSIAHGPRITAQNKEGNMQQRPSIIKTGGEPAFGQTPTFHKIATEPTQN